jgi:hypothetical protein
LFIWRLIIYPMNFTFIVESNNIYGAFNLAFNYSLISGMYCKG